MPGSHPSSSSGRAPEPARQIGPYEILLELGKGSFGAVYLARRPGLDRLFAVKILTDAVDPESHERFHREARVASRLSHPGVVPCLELGHDPTRRRSYLVMDFVPGRTLKQELEVQKHLSPRAAALLIADVAEAMAAAHEAGVVHRDLKPANILIDSRNGRPRVSDFGLARDLHTSRVLTRTGEMLGTPYYMSPEQVRGERGDARTDVYALGVILYELLTGRRPFEASNVHELAVQITSGKHKAPSVTRPVPPALEAICQRALELDPGKRFAAAHDMGKALRAAVRELEGARLGSGAPKLVLALTTAAALMAGLALGRASGPSPPEERGERHEDPPTSQVTREPSPSEKTALGPEAHAALEEELESLRAQLREGAQREAEASREVTEHAALLGGLSHQAGAAVEALVKRLEREPASLVRARLLEHRLGAKEALSALQAIPAEAHTPAGLCLQHRLAMVVGSKPDVEGAFELLRQGVEPGSPAGGYLALAEGLRSGETQRAVDKAWTTQPQQEELLWVLASVFSQAGAHDRALEAATRYLEHAPLCADMRQLRAVTYWRGWVEAGGAGREDLEASLADLLWARQTKPIPSSDWLNPGICLVSLGRPRAAKVELTEALRQRGPESERNRARVWLGNAAVLLGDLDSARRWWLEAIETSPPGSTELAEYLPLTPPDLQAEVRRLMGPVPLRVRYRVTWGG